MKIIVANWKMNGDIDLVNRFMNEIDALESAESIRSANTTNVTVVICPPAALLCQFTNFSHRHNHNIGNIGAQNCFYEEAGAFTGENSPKLLKEIGCSYVILGHSERRSIFGENDEMIFKKWEMALRNNLIPIVCIGEKIENRNSWKEIIADQLHLFLNHSNHLNQPNNTNQQQMHNNTIFAYEPVWSIGTGLIPTSEEISERSRFIKELLGDTTRLLYGGSVNSNNAAQILECQNVDGLLIGGASLKIDEFKKIIEIAKHSCSE